MIVTRITIKTTEMFLIRIIEGSTKSLSPSIGAVVGVNAGTVPAGLDIVSVGVKVGFGIVSNVVGLIVG